MMFFLILRLCFFCSSLELKVFNDAKFKPYNLPPLSKFNMFQLHISHLKRRWNRNSQARCCRACGDPVETSALAGRGEEKIGYLKKADAGASWMILGGIFDERLMCGIVV